MTRAGSKQAHGGFGTIATAKDSQRVLTLRSKQAEALLKKRIGEIATGDFVTPTDRRVTVEQVYQLLLADYRMNDRASLEGAEQRWNKRLKQAFGDLKASQVTTELLNKFVLDCQADKLSNATINRDLAALKRAFNLAYRAFRSARMVKLRGT